ncbi:MAG: hypothetical protein AAF696_28230 [Bacteroidota bacterium]
MLSRLFEVLCFLLIPSISFAQYYGEDISTPSTWTVGIKASTSILDADIESSAYGKQGGLFFEKNLSRIIDLRIEARIGQNRGQNLFASSNHLLSRGLNGQLNPGLSYDSASQYFHNYQHSYASLGVHVKLNINRIFTVLGAEKWDIYLLGGLGAYGYESRINALNDQDQLYDFNIPTSLQGDALEERLNSLFDDTYESLADRDLVNSNFIGPFTLTSYFLTGAGFRIHLTESLGIGLEGNYLFFGDDLLDGQQWQENGELSPNRDKLLSLGLLLDFAF